MELRQRLIQEGDEATSQILYLMDTCFFCCDKIKIEIIMQCKRIMISYQTTDWWGGGLYIYLAILHLMIYISFPMAKLVHDAIITNPMLNKYPYFVTSVNYTDM